MSDEQNLSGPQGAPEQAAPQGDGGNDGAAGTAAGRFRRRRRRKKPGAGQVNIQASAAPVEGGDAAAAGQAANSEGQSSGQSGTQPQPGQPGEGRRRRKKKNKRGGAFQAGQGQQGGHGRQQTHQPGNTMGGFGNGGGRRQKKQRGSNGGGGRAFVGPMDHSYRAVNGNYADAPPSTIQVNGNHNSNGRGHQRNNAMNDSGHQSQFLPTYYEPKPPAIAEDAPVKVYCFIDDLFVTAKITEAARKLGVKIAFVKAEKDDLARITDEPEETRAHLIIFDLNNVNAKPLTVIPKIRTRMKKTVSIIGFLSHLQGDLKAKAIEAGCDSVMPRAAFSQTLPNLLRRYGLEEDMEVQDAQQAYFA